MKVGVEKLIAQIKEQRDRLDTVKGRWNKYAPIGAENPELFLFKDYTEDVSRITEVKWTAPHAYPINEHPRLLLTSDNLPLIRKKLDEETATNSFFKALVKATVPDDCVLPAASYQGEHGTVGGAMEYNHNEDYLIVIQAKALAYLLYDNEYYGYQAILYMKNYLMSLEIKQIPSDQTRRYGYVMRVAALVYDWCYDLLTEQDKVQFIAGVENCLCRGRNAIKKSKMEVGFPPFRQGAVEGHACEFQILRDYLSFAVAIYNENASWYEYIAGRIYEQFIPVRNYYYSMTGVVHQGTGYAVGRYSCDLYSAWIFKTATGENPYGDVLLRAGRGIFNYEFAPGYIFNDGDKTGDWKPETDAYYTAYLIAYLYRDSNMLAMADYLMALRNRPCGVSYNELNAVAFVVLRGMCELSPATDRYEKMNLIQYNGSPLGQYIVRSAWDDASSPAVFMRIRELSSGNHEHMDTGTFEVYYKGMLTSDGGCYNNNNHFYTKYYHGATISHNGLIIYNPDLASSDEGYYSGGQRRLVSPGGNIQTWLANENMQTGRIIARAHGYADAERTIPRYAYVAGDIAKAYDAATVAYVGRRMLTVYTGDEYFPMALFIYDDISARSESFEKRFLLQITSPTAPVINRNTVITENGGGRLVLTSLSDGVLIRGVGGRAYDSANKYDCKNSRNYFVNGAQMMPMNGRADDGHWGRVEIVSTARATDATFMNLLYVTDKGNEEEPEVSKITQANGVEGAIFDEKIAAIFATAREGADTAVSCTVAGSGEMDYYVSGLAAGEWKVTVDGETVGTYTVNAFTKGTYDEETYLAKTKDSEGGLLTFRAPSGSVVITPVN